jgi:hypothetical protein
MLASDPADLLQLGFQLRFSLRHIAVFELSMFMDSFLRELPQLTNIAFSGDHTRLSFNKIRKNGARFATMENKLQFLQ